MNALLFYFLLIPMLLFVVVPAAVATRATKAFCGHEVEGIPPQSITRLLNWWVNLVDPI